jgi:hypothetical protein
MAKPRKKNADLEPPPMPQIGDKVTKPRSESVLEVTSVSRDGDEVNLQLPGTNLQWFRVRSDTLTFVERKAPAKTSNPFTTAEPVFNAGEVMARIHTVERENLQRLKEDIAILTKYLMTQNVPKGAVDALEGLSRKQEESWETAVERIEELIEE